MQPIEIIVIVCAVGIVVSYIGVYMYKRIKHLPTGDCADCKKRMSKIVKEYHKKYR